MTLIEPGLTTTEAPFIEQARGQGTVFLEQPYQLYSPGNHRSWQSLYRRMEPLWERHANRRFREGLDTLGLDRDRVPRLADINSALARRTGFLAQAVAGYLPAFQFFECLSRREFPTTITIRREDRLDYLPEPDIFHDLAGHVPMHVEPVFADALTRFGECARTAATAAAGDQARLSSIIRAMARFFWFTIEFGLMREQGAVKAYGSGLLSSAGELPHAIASPDVQRYPLQLEWVVNQPFEIDHYQPLLFLVNDFDHLFELVNKLEVWMKSGRLNNVALGEPAVSEADLNSFTN